jgi:hypothetical protein
LVPGRILSLNGGWVLCSIRIVQRFMGYLGKALAPWGGEL